MQDLKCKIFFPAALVESASFCLEKPFVRETVAHCLLNTLQGLSTILISFQTPPFENHFIYSPSFTIPDPVVKSSTPKGRQAEEQENEGCCHAVVVKKKTQLQLRRLLLLDQISPRCPFSALLSHRPLIPHQPLAQPPPSVHWLKHSLIDQTWDDSMKEAERASFVTNSFRCFPVLPSSVYSPLALLRAGPLRYVFFFYPRMPFLEMD